MSPAVFGLPLPKINIRCSFSSSAARYSPHFRFFIKCSLRPSAAFGFRSVEVASAHPFDIATVVSPYVHQTYQLKVTRGHVQVLSFVACAVAISTLWVFCSVVPALQALKRAAESVEKQMIVMQEKLPDKMASVQLSGMAIGELTVILSYLCQEITQSVRRTTGSVRMAEQGLRMLVDTIPPGGALKRKLDT